MGGGRTQGLGLKVWGCVLTKVGKRVSKNLGISWASCSMIYSLNSLTGVLEGLI